EPLAALSSLMPQDVSVPMRSTVTGEDVAGPELLADYWAENLRQPVRFDAAIQALIESGHGLFVEMSPHPILVSGIEEIQQAEKKQKAAFGSLRRGQEDRMALLLALGGLWVLGHPVSWEKLFPVSGRRVELPTYPWQRQRYWVRTPIQDAGATRS